MIHVVVTHRKFGLKGHSRPTWLTIQTLKYPTNEESGYRVSLAWRITDY